LPAGAVAVRVPPGRVSVDAFPLLTRRTPNLVPVSSPWFHQDRSPLSGRALDAALVTPGSLWRDVRVVAQTGSTNDDVAREAEAGAAEGLVVVAESQTAGRGRLDRTWVSPPRAGLTFSMLLRPGVAPARRAWLPLLVGLSLRRAVRRVAGLEAGLKWPNDLVVDGRKLAGVLAQVVGDAAVVGVGLNVSTRRDELPNGDASSLALEGAGCTDREALLRAVLRQFAEDYLAWRLVDGDPGRSGVHDAYAAACVTLGRQVTVHLPTGATLTGGAVSVDPDGRLVVRVGEEEYPVAAGDVVHVR
jgi:BirA family transcriptional regulator, biotin operon repressor / biotin---[acetyl-CoA-carboxylase] ligase